jgi:iron complex transport system permease protein
VRSRAFLVLLALALLLPALVCLRLFLGPSGFEWPSSDEVWRLRMDRVLCAVVVGASLALAGAFLQTLLRNPLASPDLIGPTSGASFAVMLGSYLTTAAAAPLSGPGLTTVNTVAALFGSLAALVLVYVLSQRRGFVEPVQLVLVGLVVGILFGAGSMLLMHLMPDRGLSMARWTIGALSDDTPRAAIVTAGFLVAACGLIGFVLAPMLDAASLSDEEAASLGVPIQGLRIGLFAMAGLLTAAAVVIAGPVGFVGLVSPHLIRLGAGSSHRIVIPGSALCGAAVVVGADAIVRLIDLKQGRVPMGVVTSIGGGLAFIWMLRSRASGLQRG